MPNGIAWLPEAAKDVARLRAFILKKNPGAAAHAAKCIKEAAQILGDNPEAGKPVEELLSFRDLFIPFGNGNYIIRYRKVTNRVVIVRVRHSKEEGF